MYIPPGWILFTHTFLYELQSMGCYHSYWQHLYNVFTVKLYFGWPLRGQFWTFAGYVNLSRSYVWETWGITPLSADKSFWGGLSCMLLKQVDVNQSAHLKFDNFDNEGQLLCVHHDMMVACLNWKKKSKLTCFLSTWVGLSKAYVLETLLCYLCSCH